MPGRRRKKIVKHPLTVPKMEWLNNLSNKCDWIFIFHFLCHEELGSSFNIFNKLQTIIVKFIIDTHGTGVYYKFNPNGFNEGTTVKNKGTAGCRYTERENKKLENQAFLGGSQGPRSSPSLLLGWLLTAASPGLWTGMKSFSAIPWNGVVSVKKFSTQNTSGSCHFKFYFLIPCLTFSM